MNCPECGLSDQVQNVGSVIDSEQTTSSGIGAGVGTPGVGIGVGSSHSRTRLAERLAPPNTNLGCVNALALGGGIPAVIFWLAGGDEAPASLVVALFVIMALAVPGIWAFLRKRGASKSFEQYSEAVKKMRSAYYCRRDDIVFNHEVAGPPLAVKKHFFESSLNRRS